MSTKHLKTFRRAADCSTLTVWEESEEALNPRAKAGPPVEAVPVAVADVTRKLRAVKGGEDRTESFVFTVRPSVPLSLQAGDIVESLVGAGVLENAKKPKAGLVLGENAPATVPVSGEGTWSFRKLDGEPTVLRVVGKVAGTGPRLKCLQPPNRCDP